MSYLILKHNTPGFHKKPNTQLDRRQNDSEIQQMDIPNKIPALEGCSLKGYCSDGSPCYGHDAIDGKPFKMTIEGRFPVEGVGCVITGKIESGSIRPNSEIILLGDNQTYTTTILSLEMFRLIVPYAEEGDNVGIFLPSEMKDVIHKGMIVSSEELDFSIEKLRTLLEKKNWNEAKDYCLRNIDQHENLCDSLVGIYQHLNDYQKSLEMVSKVKMLKDYSNSNVLKYSAAFGEYKAYMALKDFEKAKSVCEYFISIVPDEKVKLDGTNMKQEAKADLEEINRFLNSKSSQNAKEQEYLDNLKDFLEDDAEITPRERKMLDRIRQSLGISEERAAELEASSKPQLTEDEQEYSEMYREYAEKGEISEKERHRLNKFAVALGISDERIKEIEMFE